MSRELLEAINQFIIDQSNLGFSKADVLLEEIERELEKPEPELELDYRRVLKEINEFIKADILPEEIKAELAKPEPVAWKTTDIFGRALFTDSNAVYKRWIYEGMECESLYTHPPAKQKPLSDSESNLYEALKCLVEQTRDGMGLEYDDGEWPALDKAREALAKAKGYS